MGLRSCSATTIGVSFYQLGVARRLLSVPMTEFGARFIGGEFTTMHSRKKDPSFVEPS